MRRQSVVRLVQATVALTVLVVAGLLLGCAKTRQPEGSGPIMLIGMDALDWRVMEPLVAAGRLPHFERLMGQSVHGDMQTIIPFVQSPAIWTTIATGKYPERHGVSGFLQEGEAGTPVHSGERKVKAIWNILSSAGMDVGIVGWLVTWPCEAVRGFMVSDYLQYNFEEVPRFGGQTYPEELFEEVSPLIIEKIDVPLDSLAWLVNLKPGEVRDPAIREGMEALRWIYAADETFARIGLKLWREKRPAFMAVYFRGPDAVSHKFWGHRPGADPARAAGSPFAPVVDNYYVYMDNVLGRYLAEIDSSVSLLVMSDHGYQGGTVLEDGTLLLGVGSHREMGILVAKGPHFRGSGTIQGASVEDVTPTLLYHVGLPLARDMDGEVLWSLFPPDYIRRHPARFIETYETDPARAKAPVDGSPVDEILLERLRSLGYL